ncbi:MAG: VanW family protein [Acidimicrobiia bacterium]
MVTLRLRAILFTAVPVLILLLPLSVYFMDSAAASDLVARNVSISGIDVARFTRTEALVAVDEYATALTSQTATVSVNGTTFELDPEDVGLAFDSAGAVDAALVERKDGIGQWLTAFSTAVDVPVSSSIDVDMLEVQLLAWEAEAIPNPAYEGSIAIEERVVVFDYPHAGEKIDREAAALLIAEALDAGETEPIVLPTSVSQPVLTEHDIDTAVAEAKRIMRTPVVLTEPEYGFVLEVDPIDVARALQVGVSLTAPATIEYTLDTKVFTPLIESSRPDLELAPVDAYWETVVVDDHEPWDENYAIRDSEKTGGPANDAIRLVPAKSGTAINVSTVRIAIAEAALGDGSGELPIVRDTPPDFTTEEAEAFGTLYEVSEFTTYMPGTNRAHNIKLMADLIDETIVMPGETFSVNEKVGRRTLEKGFKYDCAIVKGELQCEEEPVNIGGGVSQFGTTIFNAIYFGCYEDVVHAPHSIYFTKYPEGREATLGYPSPDVAFKNDSQAPVIIRTSYTNRSVTVTFFGNQEGMTCGTVRSDRTNVSPPVLEYQADPDNIVAPGDEVTKSSGSKGWSITNTRIFYAKDGTELKREPFQWRYRGEKNVILVHPCDPRAGGNGACPVQVPAVGGLTAADASAAITGAGFVVVVVEQPTEDPAQAGVVLSVDPAGWQDPGTSVTITVGSYTEPPPPVEPEEGS